MTASSTDLATVPGETPAAASVGGGRLARQHPGLGGDARSVLPTVLNATDRSGTPRRSSTAHCASRRTRHTTSAHGSGAKAAYPVPGSRREELPPTAAGKVMKDQR
ncbi:hypothetical protein [Streptomyces canus]|uniref:hypothetical protein n=1 Tax=Streptomyces canus TaxID=58343 RepID=UPI002E356F31|nr:hypothetical protein [Streptomyces canus]